MGAKNHAIILPDANKEATIEQLAGAAFGAAGQRCMALSVAIMVGEAKNWVPDLVNRAKQLKVSAGHEPGTDVGPVISKDSKARIESLIESGIKAVSFCLDCLFSYFQEPPSISYLILNISSYFLPFI